MLNGRKKRENDILSIRGKRYCLRVLKIRVFLEKIIKNMFLWKFT